MIRKAQASPRAVQRVASEIYTFLFGLNIAQSLSHIEFARLG
jgi:hypothetical protein